MLPLGYRSFGSKFHMHKLTQAQKRARVNFCKYALNRKRKKFPKIQLHADEKIFTMRDLPDKIAIQNQSASKHNYRKSKKGKNGKFFAIQEQLCESKARLRQLCNVRQILGGVQVRGRCTVPTALWHHPSDGKFNIRNFTTGSQFAIQKLNFKP